MGATKLQQDASRQALDVRRSVGKAIARLREDAGISRRGLAVAAGLSPGYVRLLESGGREASLETLASIGIVLGADVSVRLFPTTGPAIHDRTQAPMEEALLTRLHAPWIPSPGRGRPPWDVPPAAGPRCTLDSGHHHDGPGRHGGTGRHDA